MALSGKIEPELANILLTIQDINKDTFTRLAELGEFLHSRMQPIMPASQLWQYQKQQYRLSSGASKAERGGLDGGSIQAPMRANQYLAFNFMQHVLILFEQMFPRHISELHWFRHFWLFKEANFERYLPEVQIEWSRIAQLLGDLFDLAKPDSLASILGEPERYVRDSLAKQPLRVPIDYILPPRTVNIIREKALAELPAVYHNLLSEKEHQKRALEQENSILLSPWEAMIFYFLRSMSSIKENVQPFFNAEEPSPAFDDQEVQQEREKSWSNALSSLLLKAKPTEKSRDEKDEFAERLLKESRMDLSRLQTILFTKLLDSLLEARYKEVYEKRGANGYLPCENFINAIEEFIFSPSNNSEADSPAELRGTGFGSGQNMAKSFLGGLPSPIVDPDAQLTTGCLEAVYVLVTLLQRKEYMFSETNTAPTYQTSSSGLKTSMTQKREIPASERRQQLITDPEINLLFENKIPIFLYLKRMFKEANKSPYQNIANTQIPLQFRTNRVSDVAKVWLQVLQPWKKPSDFILVTQNLNKDPQFMLFDNKGNLNVNLFTILTHTSISSQTPPFDFFAIEDQVERDREREQWTAYVREMSLFYFDLFVDYVQGLLQQGIYTVEDALVFDEVLEFFKIREENLLDVNGQMAENTTKYILDGCISLEQFLDMKMHLYHTPQYLEQFFNSGLKIRAFELDFLSQLRKLYTKLRSYNYGFEIDQVVGGQSAKGAFLNDQAHQILSNVEETIRRLELALRQHDYRNVSPAAENYLQKSTSRFSDIGYQTGFGGEKKSLTAKQLDFSRTSTVRKPPVIFGKKLAGDREPFKSIIEPAESVAMRRTTQNMFRTPRLADETAALQFGLSETPSRPQKITPFNHEVNPFEEEYVSKQRGGAQPRQGEGVRHRTLATAKSESKSNKILAAKFYKGNEWDRILSSDEYRILYYLFRAIAFLVDKATKAQYKAGETQPQCQVLRRFVSIYTFIQLLISMTVIYWVLCFCCFSG